MPNDSTRARLLEYEKNLRRCSLLFMAAELAHKEPTDSANRFINSLSDEEAKWAGPLLDADCDYVISPTLHGYVLWVLRSALDQGIKRLYFLARDGYLMYQVAEKIREALDLPIECRYFYCSRYSVRIPMFHLEQEEALEYICRGGIDVTLTKVLNRAGLSEKEQERVAEELKQTPFGLKLTGEAADHADQEDFAGITIPYAMLAQLRDTLRENEYFMECMIRHSEDALPALEEYFRQEGMMDEIPMALVDSGWTGSMQKVMKRLLRSFGKQSFFLSGFYWGLYELPADVDPKEYHCYYFSPDTNRRGKVYFSNNLFEEIFSAPHGITLRYEEQGGLSTPVTQEAEELHKDFIDQIERRIRAYADGLITILSKDEGVDAKKQLTCANDHEVIYEQLALFMGDPLPEEAELFGRLSFSDDVLEYGGQLAAVMTEEELTANHAGRKVFSLLGTSSGALKESAWYEASAVLNGHNVERHIRRYKRYKNLLYRNKARTYRKQRRTGN